MDHLSPQAKRLFGEMLSELALLHVETNRYFSYERFIASLQCMCISALESKQRELLHPIHTAVEMAHQKYRVWKGLPVHGDISISIARENFQLHKGEGGCDFRIAHSFCSDTLADGAITDAELQETFGTCCTVEELHCPISV